MANEQQIPPKTATSSGMPRWLIVTLSIVVALAVLVGGVLWYISTPGFAEKVRVKIVAVLESATGGRVELSAFHWDIWHLAFEADDLTIHGLEDPGEVPYAHVDVLRLRLKVLSLIHPQAGVRLLELDHPVFHLIVYPNGTTNQPTPKQSSSNANGTINTIFDLKADRVSASNGWAIVNERKVPLSLSASNLSALVQYRYTDDKYVANVSVADLTTVYQKEPEVHSHLSADAVIGRDMVRLDKLDFASSRSHLVAEGQLLGFADPKITLAADGHVALRDIAFLTGLEEITAGDAEVHVKGAMAGAEFHADGNLKVTGAAYRASYLQLSGIKLSTDLHLDPKRIQLTHIYTGIAGGQMRADFTYTNWQNPVAKTTPAAELPKADFAADVRLFDVREVLRSVLSPRYSDIGFNTAVTGRATGGWTGSPAAISASVKAKLTGLERKTGVPAQGDVDASYEGSQDRVIVRTLQVTTPASTVKATGVLDVKRRNSGTSLQADVTTTNLAEFDPVLLMVGLGTAQNKSPSSTLPVQLHGQAHYAGRVYGPLDLLRVTGHLDVTNFDTVVATAQPHQQAAAVKVSQQHGGIAVVQAGPAAKVQKLQWDALHTDVDIAWNKAAVSNLTLARGKTLIQGGAEIDEQPGSRKAYDFGKLSPVKADAGIHDASVTDLLQIAGQQNIPVTGTLNLRVVANGSVNDLNAAGHLSIVGGSAYGQPYKSLNADIAGNHSDVGVKNLVFLLDGGRLDGDGGYDINAETFHANITGSRFDLAHMEAIKNSAEPVGGTLQFHFTGSGKLAQPVVQGSLQVLDVALRGQRLGEFDANVRTAEAQKTIYVDAKSTLLNSHLAATGQVQLTGNYPAQARLTINDTDVAPLVAIFAPKAAGAHSEIDGSIVLNGPLKTPKQLHIDAALSTLSLTLPQFTLKNDGPLRFSLDNGRVRIDQFKMTGPDSVLTAQGTAGVFGNRDIAMNVDGSVNLGIAQQFSTEIVSSGRTVIHMHATGTFDRPDLTGQVKFVEGNFSWLDFPNGISHLNGTLNFNQDRLEVGKVTAQTGGGLLTLGGFITYENGLYANLSVSAKDVRVRYPQGISSTANADLRFTGSPAQSSLSGNILITRFALQGSISATSNGATVSAPPDPNSPLSHILMDVHVQSSPQLNFENSYANLSGSVDLRVRGSVAAPSVLGRISISQGSANFAGVDYQLQRGDIYFSNPVRIDPVIDLDASAQVEDYDISLGVHGTLEKLNTTYRSSPPLPQADIIALLALGRTQEEGQIYQQQQSEAGVNSTTSALLGGALNATVSNRVQKLFGVGQVKIDPNFVGSLGNSTARVTVTQQLSKQVTVTYATNVNETSQQLIQVQIAVNRDVSLLLTRDESGVFNGLIHIRQRKR